MILDNKNTRREFSGGNDNNETLNRNDANEIAETELLNDRVEGKNPVSEVLKAGRQIHKLWVAVPENKRYDSVTYNIIKDAKANGALIIETDKKTLDRMSQSHGHQGLIAQVAMHEYVDIDDIIDHAASLDEHPFIVILDELKESYNLGSILRIADAAGVHGIIIPKHRSVGLDAAVAKASAGAMEHVRVARVTNISAAIEELKDKGFWIYATDHTAEKLYNEVDYSGPAAIIIGSEGEGIGPSILKKCDFFIKIPMKGKVNSLNAAVAAGIVIFEASRQRGIKK